MEAALLVQFALKGACVLLATWAVTVGMRRASAASRHLVWTLGVIATLALPLVRVVGPRWDVAAPASIPETEWFAVPATTAELAPPQPVQETAVLLPQASTDAPGPAAASSRRSVGEGGKPAPTADIAPGAALLGIWLAGAGVLMLRLIYGFTRAARIARRGEEVEDDGWLQAFDEAAAALQVDRPVQLKISDDTSVPVACGLLRPTVLLPRDAMAWPAERRGVVLLHELAHVRRRDCLVQALGQCVRALHWMNPLAHIALARLRAEQERACDDLVLSTGTAAPVYADHLFEIARAFRTPAAPAWATLAMARPSQLEGRLMAILDDRCNRAPAGRRVRAVLSVCALTAIVLLGALHITTESPVARALVAAGDVTLPFMAADPDPQPMPNPEPDAAAQATPAAPATPATPAAQASDEVTDETRRRVADALATALDDQDLEVRKRAIEGLVSMRDARAVPALLRASRDANADLRELAINGLIRFDTPEARAAVLAGLKDASADVRERAASAVGRTRDAAAVPSLLPLLKDPQAGVRERAALALGMIGDSGAIDALTAALKDADARVRENAASALAMIARGERRGPRGPIPPVPPIRIGANGVPENVKDIAEFARDMALRFGPDMKAFEAEMKQVEKEIEADVEATVDAAFDSLR
jgi:beta-lactamase regulating signal transducer with metallopeptidase domain